MRTNGEPPHVNGEDVLIAVPDDWKKLKNKASGIAKLVETRVSRSMRGKPG